MAERHETKRWKRRALVEEKEDGGRSTGETGKGGEKGEDTWRRVERKLEERRRLVERRLRNVLWRGVEGEDAEEREEFMRGIMRKELGREMEVGEIMERVGDGGVVVFVEMKKLIDRGAFGEKSGNEEEMGYKGGRRFNVGREEGKMENDGESEGEEKIREKGDSWKQKDLEENKDRRGSEKEKERMRKSGMKGEGGRRKRRRGMRKMEKEEIMKIQCKERMGGGRAEREEGESGGLWGEGPWRGERARMYRGAQVGWKEGTFLEIINGLGYVAKNVYKWYKDLKEGRERVQDEQRPGRLSTSTDESHIKEIKDLVLENHRLTIKDLVDAAGISFGSTQTILKDVLCLKCVKSQLVPKTLNFLEKKRRVDICEVMIFDYQDVMKRIITEDETWIYAYDPETTNRANIVQKVN
ncbi:golgin subfamily A member 6-like protein 22 [Monomorium pharaonis]|uniref:golgin subfamily A member 6-like protein 22 n=1 Tax=Monomorium pharaonis TaxID=307658 RepID=UPI0017475C22|nr:golgin subfamily A member 6-like protein 22 [Monomorium pharaonis]